MHVRGTGVKPTVAFILKEYGEAGLQRWLAALSDDSRKIFSELIFANRWYPLQEAFIEPTLKICELFYEGDILGAWEVGCFSSESSLTTIYAAKIEKENPDIIIDNANKLFELYFDEGKVKITQLANGITQLKIISFPHIHEVIEQRMGGWMERALELCGLKNVTMKITSSMVKGDEYTEFQGTWQ